MLCEKNQKMTQEGGRAEAVWISQTGEDHKRDSSKTNRFYKTQTGAYWKSLLSSIAASVSKLLPTWVLIKSSKQEDRNA